MLSYHYIRNLWGLLLWLFLRLGEYPVFEHRGGVAVVPLLVILLFLFGLSHFFPLGVGGLDGRVPNFLALPFVEFAHSIYTFHKICVNGQPFGRVELFLPEHRHAQHLVLHF